MHKQNVKHIQFARKKSFHSSWKFIAGWPPPTPLRSHPRVPRVPASPRRQILDDLFKCKIWIVKTNSLLMFINSEDYLWLMIIQCLNFDPVVVNISVGILRLFWFFFIFIFYFVIYSQNVVGNNYAGVDVTYIMIILWIYHIFCKCLLSLRNYSY